MQLSLPFQEAPRRVSRTPIPLRDGARERRVKSILSRPKGYASEYDFTLNPYWGCQFGCVYCYAVAFVPDPDRAARWGDWVEIKSNAVELLLRSQPDIAGARVYMGSATDPYQPIEREANLTRDLLSVMVEIVPQPRLVIQTRSPLVLRDIDLLQRFAHLRVNVSITTDDEGIRREFEPSCASIARRLTTVRDLKLAGIRTGVCLSPLLPVRDPSGFARHLREIEPDRVSAGYFHISTRPFAATTPDVARRLVAAHGWTAERFRETIVAMRREYPAIEIGGMAFTPE